MSRSKTRLNVPVTHGTEAAESGVRTPERRLCACDISMPMGDGACLKCGCDTKEQAQLDELLREAWERTERKAWERKEE